MSLRYSKNRKTAVGLEKKVDRDRDGEVGRLSPSKDGRSGEGVLVSFQVCWEVIEAF